MLRAALGGSAGTASSVSCRHASKSSIQPVSSCRGCHESDGTVRAPPAIGPASYGVEGGVVAAPALGIGEHRPRVVDLAHPGLGPRPRRRRVAGVGVGVVLAGEGEVGAADLGLARPVADAEHLVGVAPCPFTGPAHISITVSGEDIGPMGTEAPAIVLVEDDPNIADLVDLYLRDAGFRVYQATSGQQGLDYVRTRRPRLAILDIGLPGDVDGIEVCRRIRADGPLPSSC